MHRTRLLFATSLFLCLGSFLFYLDSPAQESASQRQPWQRAPGPHLTTLTAEQTLVHVADAIEAGNLDEALKSFEPSNRNISYLSRNVVPKGNASLAKLFRTAKLAETGTFKGSHGQTFESRTFMGELEHNQGKTSKHQIIMIRTDERSMLVKTGTHDPGEWLILSGWQLTRGLSGP